MKISRSEPGFPLSSAIHAGLLLAAFVLFSDARKFDDAVEMVPVDLVTDSELTQIMKGEKTAREIKPTPRVDKVAPEAETKPEPPLAQAKKDIATPPPPSASAAAADRRRCAADAAQASRRAAAKAGAAAKARRKAARTETGGKA